jgi:phage I-like protein
MRFLRSETDLRIGRAAHTTQLGTGELPEWVQLLPAGTFSGIDGRGPYHMPDPDAVIRRTREQTQGHDLPIDYGHALEREGYDGDAAPAAGWISQFEVRQGQVWGRVTWTSAGADRIRGREFRFLSPVFYHDLEGDVRWIVRAGLTNRPNLQLQAVHSRELLEGARHASGSSAQPVLDEAAKAVCARLGISEPDFIKSMQEGSAGKPGGGSELDPTARAVFAQLGISEADFIKAQGA